MAGSSGGGEQAEKGRQQIEQGCRNRDSRDDDREGRHQPMQGLKDFAHPILRLQRVPCVRHGRDRAPIFAAVSRLAEVMRRYRHEYEKPAPREKRGLFLDSLEPYGEGHTTGF